jgi:hypothetical protein
MCDLLVRAKALLQSCFYNPTMNGVVINFAIYHPMQLRAQLLTLVYTTRSKIK